MTSPLRILVAHQVPSSRTGGMSRIMGFLRKKPVPAVEISGSLDLEPSEVARHLHELTEQGLIKFDAGQTLVAAV